MKVWKKMLLSITGVSILAGGAFFLPTLVNQYDDGRNINKINYVDNNTNADKAANDSKQNMAYNFKFLSAIYNNREKPYIMQIPFEPDDKQKADIKEKTETELKKWFEEGLAYELIGFYVDTTKGCEIKEINLYSLYSDFGTEKTNKITYLEVSLVTYGNYSHAVKVYLDSVSYKIYLVSVEDGYFKGAAKNMDDFGEEWSMIYSNLWETRNNGMEDIHKQIESYYELGNSNIGITSDAFLEDRFECVINSSVIWGAVIETEEEDGEYKPKALIGIRGFENGFSDVGQISNIPDNFY